MRGVCAHVIDSVNRSNSVNRVIVTTIAAIISEADLKELVRRPVFAGTDIQTKQAKRTPERGRGYSIGKVTLERTFTEAAAVMAVGTAFASALRTTSDPYFRPIKKKKVLGSTTSK